MIREFLFQVRHRWHRRNLGPNQPCSCWVPVGYVVEEEA